MPLFLIERNFAQDLVVISEVGQGQGVVVVIVVVIWLLKVFGLFSYLTNIHV